MSGQELVVSLLGLVPWVLSLSVHECAHAWSARRLGDDTAERMGRLTLNPIPHIDLFGTIILPLLQAPIAWAKPVPVDPTRFRRDVSMGAGMAITAAAGPISNVILAVLAAVGLGLSVRLQAATDGALVALLWSMVRMNVSLAVFNLLPVPPLDGSRIVSWLMPRRLQSGWEALERAAPMLLMVAVLILARSTNVIRGPVSYLSNLLVGLAELIA